MEENNRQEQITVVIVEPNKKPYVKAIKNDLQSMQEIVGGYIEMIYPYDDGAIMVCNEAGKINGLDPNRYCGNDVIAGTFFVVGGDWDDGECISLTREQVKKYLEMYDEIPEEIENTEPHFEFLKWGI